MQIRADTLYFNESNLYFNDSKHFDAKAAVNSVGVTTSSVPLYRYIAREVFEDNILLADKIIDAYSRYVDLIQLIPEKFRDADLLIQFIDVLNNTVGRWLGSIKDLEAQIDPYGVDDTYLQYLADLIGLKIISDENTTAIEKRRQVIEAIPWYKIKGSYRALKVIGYLAGVHVELKDMYTKDYATFTQADWYVGDGDTDMPPGIGGIDEYTYLMLPCDGVNGSSTFTDASRHSQTVVAHGNAKITTATSVFGGASANIPAHTDYIEVTTLTGKVFGTNPWSIDFRVKFTDPSRQQYICRQYYNANNYILIEKAADAAGSGLNIHCCYGGVIVGRYYSENANISAGVWTHLKFARTLRGTAEIAVDGLPLYLVEDTAFGDNDLGTINAPFTIGNNYDPGTYFAGQIDEFRISIGTSRESGVFTPPVEAYADPTDYYKSPHIGLVVILDKVYTIDSTDYLFAGGTLQKLETLVETARPINVVPHYILQMSAVTDRSMAATTSPGDILAATKTTWPNLVYMFNSEWSFDAGVNFDYSNLAFMSTVTLWKFGTGSKGISPDDPSFTDLETVVLSGQINSYTVMSDRVRYMITLGTAIIQDSLSELGLYLSDGTLVAACTFPDIDKESGVELITYFEILV